MGIINKELYALLIKPEPAEIWYIDDLEIKMHPDGRKDKVQRPALVVSSNFLLKNENFPLINVIPLSTKGEPDALSFPVASGIIDISADYKKDNNSLAVLPYYQPIEKKYFRSRCAKIDENTYYAVVTALCLQVIGYSDYDLEVDDC